MVPQLGSAPNNQDPMSVQKLKAVSEVSHEINGDCHIMRNIENGITARQCTLHPVQMLKAVYQVSYM